MGVSVLERHAVRMVRHRRAVVVASLAVALGLGAAGRDVHVEMDPDRTLPAHHPFVVADKAIAERFGGRRVIVAALVPTAGTVWSVPVLDRLAAVSLDLYRAEGVRATNVLSLASPNARDIRSTEDSLAVEYLMRDPPQTEADVAAIRAAYDRNLLYHGLLVSEDGQAAMVFVDFWDDVDPERAFAVVAEVVAPYRSPELAIHLTGLPVFGHYFQEYARSVGRYFLLAIAALLAVLYAAFGSIQGMLIPILTGTLATACALGMVRLSGAQLDGYNVMTPILILAVGAGHSVQMLKRYYEEFARLGDAPAAIAEALRTSGAAVTFVALAVSAGYAALVLSPFAVYWMLGVTVPLTMAVSCGVTITLLPWVLARWRPQFAFPARSEPAIAIREAVDR